MVVQSSVSHHYYCMTRPIRHLYIGTTNLYIAWAHRYICGTAVDQFGRQGLKCQKSASSLTSHDEFSNRYLEPPGMCRNDGKRPDALTLIPWSHVKCLMWNVACCDIFADGYKRSSAISTGRLLNRKHDLYSEIKNNNDIFVAFPIETMGTWCGEGGSMLANKIDSKFIECRQDRHAKEYLF